MILLPDQVIPFLQHDDPLVRDHACRYFSESFDVGPLTAEHYWAAIDRFGENVQTLGFVADLRHLPQTDASLQRLLKALAGSPPTAFEFHYQHVAREMDLAVVERHRDAMLACPQILSHVNAHLEQRLKLLGEAPLAAWESLMQVGRELARAYKFTFNPNESDALIEAAARGGEPVCRKAMDMLTDPSARDDWREIFSVRVMGLARYEPAIDSLVERLAVDTDVLREEVNHALSRIATPRVIERLVEFYPGKPWHVRLYAHVPLSRIKRPECEQALLRLLQVEAALEADPNYENEEEPLIEMILADLTDLCSLAGLDESRRRIDRFSRGPDSMALRESLLATAVMMGETLPEQSAWRKRVDASRRERDRIMKASGGLFGEMRDTWRKTGTSLPPAGDPDDQDDWELPGPAGPLWDDRYPHPVETVRNTAPKIGRNESCPCGSGKKYKKCCGK